MKFPFIGKLTALVGGVKHLHPGALIARLKGGKKSSAAQRDEAGLSVLDVEENLFEGLGDLDALDAAAADTDTDASDAPQSKGKGSEENVSEEEVAGEDTGEDTGEIADLIKNLGDVVDDVVAADIVDDEEMEAAEAKAEIHTKLRRLFLFGGIGIVVAVLLGAGTWMMFGGGFGADAQKDTPSQTQTLPQGTVAFNLDNVPYVSKKDGKASPLLKKKVPVEGASAADSPVAAAPVAVAPVASVGSLRDAKNKQGVFQNDKTLKQLGLDAAQKPGMGLEVPSLTTASFANLSSAPRGVALGLAPIDILVEQAAVGPLPRRAEDGRTSYSAYARPKPSADGKQPEIAIIITAMGQSRAATEATLNAMPQNVTLSLNAYARGLDFWVAKARKSGHEVLLNVPLEPANFPLVDPGPDMLRTLNAPAENIKKLEYILSRTSGYFGVFANFGSRFLKNEEQVAAMMEQLKARGLMYVDGGTKGSLGPRAARKLKVPWAAVDVNLDSSQDAAAMDRALAGVEVLAKRQSFAVLRTSATPLSLQRLSIWLGTLAQKGLVLTPVSALANKQPIR